MQKKKKKKKIKRTNQRKLPEGLDLKMERAEKEEKQARKRERRSLIGSEMFKR